MTKYITGNTNREMTIGGVVLPKRNYSQVEVQQQGKRSVLEVDEALYGELYKSNMFKEMVRTGQITIHDEEPYALLSTHERYQLERRKSVDFAKQLEAANTRAAEFERLYNTLKDKGDVVAKVQYDELVSELEQLRKTLDDREAKIKELEEDVEE